MPPAMMFAPTTPFADEFTGRRVVIELQDSPVHGQQLELVAMTRQPVPIAMVVVVTLVLRIEDGTAELPRCPLHNCRQRQDPSGRHIFARPVLIVGHRR